DVPVGIITGDADEVAPPVTNAQVAATHIPGARLTLLPGAGHYVFLATCTEAGVAAIPVCRLAGRQDHAHRAAIAQAKELFGAALATAPCPPARVRHACRGRPRCLSPSVR